jgi:hypothetical protein
VNDANGTDFEYPATLIRIAPSVVVAPVVGVTVVAFDVAAALNADWSVTGVKPCARIATHAALIFVDCGVPDRLASMSICCPDAVTPSVTSPRHTAANWPAVAEDTNSCAHVIPADDTVNVHVVDADTIPKYTTSPVTRVGNAEVRWVVELAASLSEPNARMIGPTGPPGPMNPPGPACDDRGGV